MQLFFIYHVSIKTTFKTFNLYATIIDLHDSHS